MATLRQRLSKLFATNVVVRRIGKNKLKVVDTSRMQSVGNRADGRINDRYSRMHTNSGYQGLNAGYNRRYNYHSTKIELYTDYESMDQDAIISSALDIYADYSTTEDETGEMLTIKTDNENIRKLLKNLFYDILNIDFNLWPWIRNMCKYGDFYLALDIAEELGIVNAQPMSPYETSREEGWDPENPYRVRFINESESGRVFLESFEVAHFRLLTDTNFLPYGKSMLEGARKTWKALVLMEDAMLIHRVMRAPTKRVFKVDIGAIAPNEVDAHMNEIVSTMKKVPYMDPATGEYNLKFNLNNMLEDYFLPVRGAQSGTEIDTLDGMEFTGIEDIDYLKHKMMAGLKVPKAFLTYDEQVEGKATLAAEDVGFSRTIGRIQKIFVSELYKLAVIHLAAQGYKDAQLINFELSLTNPSSIYEQEKITILNEKTALSQAMIDARVKSRQWIWENIWDMTEDEWQVEEARIIDDAKQQFRLMQISEEGNDPAVTKESYGTAHDLAELGMGKAQSDPGTPGARVGRPNEPNKYGKRSHIRGEDPLGKKDISKIWVTKQDSPMKHAFKGGSPLAQHEDIAQEVSPSVSLELEKFAKSMQYKFRTKGKSIISETFADKISDLSKKSKKDSEKGTFLDETKLEDDDN